MMTLARTNKRESPEELTRDKENTPDSREKDESAREAGIRRGDDSLPDEEGVPADESDIDPLAAIQRELASERDKYLRLAAEYDNYRKRSAKEMKNMFGDARADTIIKLLPVYDNLERALKMECADEAFYKGVEMTMTQLSEILEGMGIEVMQSVGEPFDPNRHSAVMSIENPELGEKTVAEEFQKGFTLGEKVLRFSTVVVAN
jgi:molecular chaperone GrpE